MNAKEYSEVIARNFNIIRKYCRRKFANTPYGISADVPQSNPDRWMKVMVDCSGEVQVHVGSTGRHSEWVIIGDLYYRGNYGAVYKYDRTPADESAMIDTYDGIDCKKVCESKFRVLNLETVIQNWKHIKKALNNQYRSINRMVKFSE